MRKIITLNTYVINYYNVMTHKKTTPNHRKKPLIILFIMANFFSLFIDMLFLQNKN